MIFYCPRTGLVWTIVRSARKVTLKYNKDGQVENLPHRVIPEYR